MTRMTLALTAALLGAATAADPPPKAEVVKASKPACALADTDKGYGSAFCVDAGGYFVTNEHVVSGRAKGSKLKLVLHAGEQEQRVLEAVVVRTDPAADLALLKVEADKPLAALPLGDDETVAELDEVIGFGFPFGKALSKTDDYPTVSVSAASVSSLRRDRERRLDRIQLDGALNPGQSGGPVVNRRGEVVGVVVSGIRGSGLNQAIPVSRLKQFLGTPEITLVATTVDPKARYDKAPVRVQVLAVPERKDALAVDLLVRSGGKERRVELKREAGGFEGAVAPFEKETGPPPVQADIRYPDGSVRVPVADAAVTVAGKGYKLSQLAHVRVGKPTVVRFADGTTAEGELTGLDKLEVSLPGQSAAFTTASALELTFTPPVASAGGYLLVAVVRRDGKEIGRAEVAKYLKGMEPSGVEGLLKGHFGKPKEAPQRHTSAAIVSTSGEFVGGGKGYTFTDPQVRTAVIAGGGVQVTFEYTDPKAKDPRWSGQFVPGFTLTLTAPRGTVLDAREYPKAEGHQVPDGAAAGLRFEGEGRTPPRASGKFVVWEVEIDNGVVRKLAVDFIQYTDDKTDAPVVGSIRYNSKYE